MGALRMLLWDWKIGTIEQVGTQADWSTIQRPLIPSGTPVVSCFKIFKFFFHLEVILISVFKQGSNVILYLYPPPIASLLT